MSLSPEKKHEMTNIFNCIFNKPLNKTTQTIKNNVILNGIEVSNTQTELKTKMDYFCKKLFCYLCKFKRLETGFDLVNVEKQIFIEIKTEWNTDKIMQRKVNFVSLKNTTTQTQNFSRICLNNKRKINVEYTHHFDFHIITGTEAWQFFCQHAGINVNELIDFIREFVQERI